MNAGFIRNFIRLTRIEHGLVLMLAVATAEIIVKKDLNFLSIPILFSLFVPLLNEIASFSLNDLLDIEADRINRRVDRPLVSGEIKKTTSVLIAIGGYALSIILATFINKVCFLIATVFALLSIAYNYHLKTLPLVGNLYIASSMAIPFLFGNLSVSPYPHPLVLSISLLAFMSGLAREIIKSAEDLEGDIKARKAQTLPALIGVKFSVFLSLVIYILFILSTSIPFAFGLKPNPPLPIPYLPLMLIIVADFIILYSSIRLIFSQEKEVLSFSRKLSLLALIVGMLGIFFGSI